MKLTILGSAAAEGIPALWCGCQICAHAQKSKGRDLRRRSCYWIDGDTLVDFGPDAFWQTQQFGIDLLKIKRILYTHSHVDHLNPVELLWRQPGYCTVQAPIDVYGNRQVKASILAALAQEEHHGDFELLHLRYHTMEPGVAVDSDDLTITALHANHAWGEVALNYLIERGGRTLLIANDTGIWRDDTWALVRGRRIDAAVLESTCGFRFANNRDGHLGAHTTVEMRDRLLQAGCITSATPVWVNHFSHNGDATHADLEAFFQPRGMGVAYDGLTVEIP